MSYTLALESVSNTGSVACVADDGTVTESLPIAHRMVPKELVSIVDQCIRTHGKPARIAVAAGPGSFTGLRISVIAARTLAWIEDLPIHCVESLAARALQEGDGLWWVLTPLKKDTTFHGLYRVTNGTVTPIQAVQACLDEQQPCLHPETISAHIIGPALTEKEHLAKAWQPCVLPTGSSDTLNAVAVAKAYRSFPAVTWAEALPAYHQASAPELQRQQQK